MKKINAILIVVLSLLAGIFISVPSFAATWPKTTTVLPRHIDAIDDDIIALSNCSGYPQGGKNYSYINGDSVEVSNIFTGGSYSYLPAAWWCSSDGSRDVVTKDGTIYTSTHHGYSVPQNRLTAERNGTVKWQKSIKVCDGMSSEYGYFRKVEMGGDGLLYGLLRGEWDSCGEVFVTLNPNTGELVRPAQRLNSSVGYSPEKVWTFDNRVIVTDDQGIVRYFANGGQEDTSKSFAIPSLAQNYVDEVWTDSSQKVYVRYASFSCNGGYTVKAYNESATPLFSYSISSNYSCSISKSTPMSNGSMAVFERYNGTNYLKRYDSNGSSQSIEVPDVKSGTQDGFMWNVADVNGNILTTAMTSSSSSDATYDARIKLIKFSDNTVADIYSERTNNPSLGAREPIASDVYGGNAYVATCDAGCTQNWNGGDIRKISVPGFGTPARTSGSFVSLTTDKDGDGLNLGQEIAQGTLDSNKDYDGDGLSDYIESQWYPGRQSVFCGTSCAYPNPTSKDVFVEVDWMKNGSRVIKPTQTQLDSVVASYANQGITAHFDTGQYGGGNELPVYVNELYFESDANNLDFYDLKNGNGTYSANFNANRLRIWHYMISADKVKFKDPDNQSQYITNASGVSFTGDDDLAIAVGHIEDDQTSFGYTSRDTAISGTILHEVGHNLCLSKGIYTGQSTGCQYSGVDTHAGQSYVSSMNYDKQMFQVDYSHGANGAPSDHDDWTAVLGGGIANFADTDRNAGDSAGVSGKEKKPKKLVRGITSEEAKELKKAGKLGK